MNQLYACYARGKEVRELAVIMGEAALAEMDRKFLEFADAFENQYLRQGEFEDRTIEETLDLGWKLLRLIPRSELKRVREEYLTKYYAPEH